MENKIKKLEKCVNLIEEILEVQELPNRIASENLWFDYALIDKSLVKIILDECKRVKQ